MNFGGPKSQNPRVCHKRRGVMFARTQNFYLLLLFLAATGSSQCLEGIMWEGNRGYVPQGEMTWGTRRLRLTSAAWRWQSAHRRCECRTSVSPASSASLRPNPGQCLNPNARRAGSSISSIPSASRTGGPSRASVEARMRTRSPRRAWLAARRASEITGPTYQRGANIDYIYRISPRFIYNSGRFRIAPEIEYTVAGYATTDANGNLNIDTKGVVTDSKAVANVRLLLGVYLFF